MKVQQARFVLSALVKRDLVTDGLPQIAFVGRSNVGKSSLLNRLSGRKALARTSSSPGKTRAVNYFLINETFYFVDLPGFGYARASKRERRSWAKLMDDYFDSTRPRPCVVQLVDAKAGATPLDVQATDYLRHRGLRPLVVATKIDRLARSRRSGRLGEIRAALALDDDQLPLPCSARTGEGVRQLWRGINAFLRAVVGGATE